MISRRSFKPFAFPPELDKSEGVERFHKKHEAESDTLQHTKFDLRAPAGSHMSSVVYVEKSVVVQLEKQILGSDDWLAATAPWNLKAEINSCGFAIQNTTEELSFDYNSTSIRERPAQWLPFYSELYRKSLKPYVRNSGRAFVDFRQRGLGTPYDSVEDRLISGKNQFRETSVGGAGIDHPYWALSQNLMDLDELDDNFNEATQGFIYPIDPDVTVTVTSDGVNVRSLDVCKLTTFYHHSHLYAVDEVASQDIPIFWARLEQAGITTPAAAAGLTDQQPDLLEAWHGIRNNAIKCIKHYSDETAAVQQSYGGEDGNFPKYKSFPKTWFEIEQILDEANNPFRDPADGINKIIDPAGGVTPLEDAQLHDLQDKELLSRYARWWATFVDGKPRDENGYDFLTSYYNTAMEDDEKHRMYVLQDNISPGSLKEYLQLAFAAGKGQGLYIRTIHAILNKRAKVLEQLDYSEENRQIRAYRTYLDLVSPLGVPFTTWKDVARRYAQLDGLVLEIEDEHNGVYDNVHVAVAQKPNSVAVIKFVEPLVCGFARPSVAECGVFGERGSILPSVDRMSVSFHWCDKMSERLFNTFEMRNYYNDSTHHKEEYRLQVVSQSTFLHTTHYRAKLNMPVQLALGGMEFTSLGVITFASDGRDVDGHDISFVTQLETNPEPVFLIFYARRIWDDVPNQFKRTYNDGCAITRLSLQIGGCSNAFALGNSDNHGVLQQMTASHFPEYMPRIDRTGGVVAVAYSGLMHGAWVARDSIELRGVARCEMQYYASFERYDYEDKFELCVLALSNARSLEISKNYARAHQTML